MKEIRDDASYQWMGLVIAVLLFFWLVGVAAAPQYVLWLAVELVVSTGGDVPAWTWPILVFWQGIFLLLPTLPLAIFWPERTLKPVFQVWVVAAAYFLCLTPVRFAGPTSAKTTAVLQMIGTLLFLVGLVAFIWRQQKRLNPQWRPQIRQGHQLWLAWLLAPIPLWLWLVFGAFGSPLDTFLNLFVGLLVGLVAGLTLDFFYVRPLQQAEVNPLWCMVGGGIVAGVLLLLLGGGVGHNGMQLFLMLTLPTLSWAVISLVRWPGSGTTSKNWQAITLLVGLNAAAPLLLLDPDELILVLNVGTRDSLTWAMYALLGVVASGLLLSVVALIGRLALARHSGRMVKMRPVGMMVAGLLWVGALLLYALVGQPGFHGERIFVIFNDQADVSAAATMSDYEARRQFVYDTLVAQANGSQAEVRSTLDTLGLDYTPYYLVNAIEVDAGPFLRWWLNTRPEVDRILDSPVLRPLPALPPSVTGDAAAPTSPNWNLTDMGADRVWTELGVTGAGIVIGQSDSGVQGDHPELAVSYRGRTTGDDYNWLDPWNHTTEPTDIGGHGTHTLGSIVGQNVGVAPGATWFACVNLARNLANPALYLDCLQFMLAPYPLGGDPFTDGDATRSAHVLNNSWGCPDVEGCDPNVFLPAVRALRYAGIFVVVSAGNDGYAGCETVSAPPATYDEVFSVGALNVLGEVTAFSSRGPVTVDESGRVKPDILAPGENVLSAYPNNSYAYADGTSMAGPHVVGVVALIWSANPDLIGDIAQTEQILIETADPYTGFVTEWCGSSTLPNNVVGYGIVNAYAAVIRAQEGN